MKIKLLRDIPVGQQHDLTAGKVLDVLREQPEGSKQGGYWGWLLGGYWIQGRGEEVLILYSEAEIVEGQEEAHVDHVWGKTNLVTIMSRGRIYDRQKCGGCGITGKRFGLGETVRDGKYKADIYAWCDTAREHLRKRGKKQIGDGQ